LTRITDQPLKQHPIVVLPIIYDIGNQITTLADRRDLNTPGIIMQTANFQLKKFMEKRGVSTTESSLYAAVHDLLMNLTLQVPGQPQQQPQQMPGGPPFNVAGQMPGPMMVGPNQGMMNPGPDHQMMNQQAMGQGMPGPQQMNQGYGMNQMGPTNE
jgi:hypothetical protein